MLQIKIPQRKEEKMKTTYVCLRGKEFRFMEVDDDVIEELIDEVKEDGSNFREVMLEAFREWAEDEFGWSILDGGYCDAVLEVLPSDTVEALGLEKKFQFFC